MMSKLELRPSSEIEGMDMDKVKSLLQQHCSITVPKGSSLQQIKALAINRLHGIIFINDDEEVRDNRICKKQQKIQRKGEFCKQCAEINPKNKNNKNLMLQPIPKGHPDYGLRLCAVCGYNRRDG